MPWTAQPAFSHASETGAMGGTTQRSKSITSRPEAELAIQPERGMSEQQHIERRWAARAARCDQASGAPCGPGGGLMRCQTMRIRTSARMIRPIDLCRL